MLVSTPALVLQARKQGETSKIVTLYSEQFGKVSVIAKGAREIKSKFGGALESFALINAVFYHKKERPGLYLLAKADVVRSHSGILLSLERIQRASNVAEIILRTMHDEEANQQLFDLLVSTFGELSLAEAAPSVDPILLWFLLRFSEMSGFQLSMEPTDHDQRGPRIRHLFRVKTGEFIQVLEPEFDAREDHFPQVSSQSSIDANMISVLPESRAALGYLENATIEKVRSLRISERAFNNLSEIFSAFLAEHFTGMQSRSLKSMRMDRG